MQEEYFPLYQGIGTNMLAQVTTRFDVPEFNPYDRTFEIRHGQFMLIFTYLHHQEYSYEENPGFDKEIFNISPSFHKLLDMLVIQLTKQNPFRGNGEIDSIAVLSLDDYLSLSGCQNPTKTAKDEARKKVQRDLNTLLNIELQWSEVTSRRTDSEAEFYSMVICEHAEIRRGIIKATFSEDFVRYLTNAYVTWMHRNMFQLDNRSFAYSLGRKLALQYFMDSNEKRGSNNCVRISTVIQSCHGIISEPELHNQYIPHWERRVKERLENALDHLVKAGVLSQWCYCGSRKSQPNSLALKNVDLYVKQFIQFEFANPPDKSVRRQKKAEQKSLRAKKQTGTSG